MKCVGLTRAKGSSTRNVHVTCQHMKVQLAHQNLKLNKEDSDAQSDLLSDWDEWMSVSS